MEKNLPENIECLVIEDFGTTGIEEIIEKFT